VVRSSAGGFTIDFNGNEGFKRSKTLGIQSHNGGAVDNKLAMVESLGKAGRDGDKALSVVHEIESMNMDIE
jgi:hypothetical protein